MNKMANTTRTGLEIAVIGMAGRFPGSDNVEEFWNNLVNGTESIKSFSDAELAKEGIDPEIISNPNYIKAKGHLSGVEYFDADFFKYSEGEATAMDPQIRMFHECVWSALEDAGYVPSVYNGLIGLYGGAVNCVYWELLSYMSAAKNDLEQFAAEQLNNRDYLCRRVSYKLNLKGPSVFIQTGCSTSLVAINMACRALLTGECNIAVAGGVHINVPHKSGYMYNEGLIYSATGHCRAFDEKSDGMVPGDGVGCVVLKPLKQALADRDNIYAVVKGCAINNDGIRKVGFTAPSVEGQADVIKSALRMAKISPESIGYLEAHGTGTALGDPIEIEGLKLAFNTTKKGFCMLGSVKTNVGHLDSAAGVASFIKAVLCLKHKLIPPSINFTGPNPQLDLPNSPFYIQKKLCKWQNEFYPLRAGISSFGVGGTNAHTILEEAPQEKSSTDTPGPVLIILSAKTREALVDKAYNLGKFMRTRPDINMADLAYTLQVGRYGFNHRQMLVCSSAEEAVELLEENQTAGIIGSSLPEEEERSLTFVFPGQGSQYINMGLELYRTEAVFREQIDLCFDKLKSFSDCNMKDILYPANDTRAIINQPEFALPLLFIFEYAFARFLMQWGIFPNAVSGYGIGEYAAACLADVFSFEDALKLVVVLGKNMQEGPQQHRSDDGKNPLQDAYKAEIAQIKLCKPAIPCFSFFSGREISFDEAIAQPSRVGRLGETIYPTTGITGLLTDSRKHVFAILGPGNNLIENITNEPDGMQHSAVSFIREPTDTATDKESLLSGIGRLWVDGIDINWTDMHSPCRRYRIPLPAYPFRKRRYWIDGNPLKAMAMQEDTSKNQSIEKWFYIPVWKRSILPVNTNIDNMDKNTILMFSDKSPVGEKLEKYLMESDNPLVTVKQDFNGYAKIDCGNFRLNTASEEDFIRLFNNLRLTGEIPDKIIFSTVLEKKFSGLPDDMDKWLDTGFYSLIYLARALKKNHCSDIEIIVLTDNMYNVTGGEQICPQKALLLGPTLVMGKEYPGIRCRLVDITMPGINNTRESLFIKQLANEVQGNLTDTVCAYRNNYRWIQTFESVSWHNQDKIHSRLKNRGVYLITGGCGGIGLSLAEYIARAVKKSKIVLTGRSLFPAKSDWKQWLAEHEPNNRTSTVIRTIRKLEALGSDVLVFSADVADIYEMQKVIEQVKDKFGEINGIIHSAGIPDGGIMEMRTKELTEKVMMPKVKGTMVLGSLFKDYKLDFFALCSSLASLSAEIGEAAYVGANAFLDAFAAYQTSQHDTFTVSINWDEWSSVGMAVNSRAAMKDAIGSDLWNAESNNESISPEQGAEAFAGILHAGLPQVAVSVVNLENRMKEKNKEINFPVQKKIDGNKPHHPETEAQNANSAVLVRDIVSARNNIEIEKDTSIDTDTRDVSVIERDLLKIFNDKLGLKSLKIHDDFFDSEVDSLTLVRAYTYINNQYTGKLQVQDMFSGKSIGNLAEIIHRKDNSSGNPENQNTLVEF